MSLADEVEARLRELAYTRRLRFRTVLEVCDKLRSGRIHAAAFTRSVNSIVGAPGLSEPEMTALLARYAANPDASEVAWRDFAEVVDAEGGFLEKVPTASVQTAAEKAAPVRTYGLPDATDEDTYQVVAQRLREHLKLYGESVRGALMDFDRTNRGTVTANQLRRGLPRPADMTDAALDLIVARFAEQGDTERVAYLALHRELEGIRPEAPMARRMASGPADPALLLSGGHVGGGGSSDAVLGRMASAFHRFRVRPLEYFRDYDRLRSSYINADQFKAGLGLACQGSHFPAVSATELEELTRKFSEPGKGVNYRRFCEEADTGFLTARPGGLESAPEYNVPSLTRSQLVSDLKNVGPTNGFSELEALLERIRTHINARRIDVYPLFNDFDRRHGFTKGVTEQQFARLLDTTLGMALSPRDVKLLAAQYASATVDGHVNYHAFLGDVDRATGFSTHRSEKLYHDPVADVAAKLELAAAKKAAEAATKGVVDEAETDAALAQVRLYAVQRRLRARDFFRDFDRLRTGYLTPALFIRGVAALCPQLSGSVLEALAARYTDPGAMVPRTVAWQPFAASVDEAFSGGESELARSPTKEVAPLSSTLRDMQLATQPPPETRGFDGSALDEYYDAMERGRQQIQQGSLSIEEPLADFDKHARGVVTAAQFAQALDVSKIGYDDREKDLLTRFYASAAPGDAPDSVRYREFLEDLQPPAAVPDLFRATRDRTAAAMAGRVEFQDMVPAVDGDEVLASVRAQVQRERMRVLEHLRPFDRLKTGRVTAGKFESGLHMAKLVLSAAELRALTTKYAAQDEPGLVEYVRFSDDCESVFTVPGLESNPLATPEPMATNRATPPPSERAPELTEGQRAAADILFAGVAESARARRLNMAGDFGDFDRSNRGVVSLPQFHRVLSNLALLGDASQESVDALTKRYLVTVGGAGAVNYRRFLQDCDAAGRAIHADLYQTAR